MAGPLAVAFAALVAAGGAKPLDWTSDVGAANTGTKAGAERVVELLHARVTGPPFSADFRARSLCQRYLPAAVKTLEKTGDAARGIEALAHCRMLAGDAKAAKELVGRLQERCSGVEACGENLERALRFAERWLEPDVVAIKGEAGVWVTTRARLQVVRSRREQVLAAAGAHDLRGGLLVTAVAKGSAGAKAGLRPGDVILNVAGVPVRSLKQLAERVRGGTPMALVAVRSGTVREQRWPGGPPVGLKVLPVPEHLGGDKP